MSFKTSTFNKLLLLSLWSLSLYITYFYGLNNSLTATTKSEVLSSSPLEIGGIKYDRFTPIIFVGGMPRSGTTLMRTMLDAHPMVRCGQETRVIPRLLGMRNQWTKSQRESLRLMEAGVTPEILNEAITTFILEIIVRHGKPAPFLCNKDPFTIKSTEYLYKMFPNSKYIFMIRDGRATTHSIISRHVTISGFNLNSYRDVITKWNKAMDAMYQQCTHVGPDICLMVKYEALVLHPVAETKRIMKFLNIPWSDTMLNHEQHIANISLSSVEKSTDQVIKPLYLEALTSWYDKFPDDVAADLHEIAPMLHVLGYDPKDMHQKYGTPDQFMLNKTNQQ